MPIDEDGLRQGEESVRAVIVQCIECEMAVPVEWNMISDIFYMMRPDFLCRESNIV